MRKVVIVALLIGVCWCGRMIMNQRRTPHSLESRTPVEAGLLWKECLVSAEPDFQHVQDCFGDEPDSLHPSDAELHNFGQRRGDNFQLTIGEDEYETRTGWHPFNSCHILSKNGWRIHRLCGQFFTHSPNLLIQNIDGKIAWSFIDVKGHTVIYDGEDVRKVYGLDNLYRPYHINNKLLFIGEKEGKQFVVYDDAKITPAFDHINISYCCMTRLWSAQYSDGTYRFWGERDGQTVVVQLTSTESEDNY